MRWLLAGAMFLVLLTGCQRWQVQSSRHTDSWPLQGPELTYGWGVPPGAVNHDHPFYEGNAIQNWLMEEVSLVLNETSWTFSDLPRVQFYYHVLLREQVATTYNDATYAREWYLKGQYVDQPVFHGDRYALVYLQVYDTYSEKMIWSGYVRHPLNKEIHEPEQARKVLRLLVAQWQEDFNL